MMIVMFFCGDFGEVVLVIVDIKNKIENVFFVVELIKYYIIWRIV